MHYTHNCSTNHSGSNVVRMDPHFAWLHVESAGHMVDDLLHDEHSLRRSKATKCCVGWEIGAADETLNVKAGNVVCISGVEHGMNHHLKW